MSSSAVLRVAVLDDYQQVARTMADWSSLGPGVTVEFLSDPIPAAELASRLKDFDVLVAMRERTPFPRTLLTKLPNLKLLVTTGKRNLAIDLVAAAERDIPVCGTSIQSTPTAELTWALILALARRVPHEAASMRAGGWQTTLGIGLQGKVLGVVGLGKLGSQVARVGQAFGMQVLAWSQNLTTEAAEAAGARHVDKQTLFREADIVTLHVVLSDRTRGLVRTPELDAMKRTAYLVNTARGPIVEEAALLDALRHGVIAGAALDVYDEEPLPSDHPLRTLDNVILTPHLGYVTEENYREMYGQAVEDIRAYRDGSPIRVIS